MDEDVLAQIMYLMFAQLGVNILFIQDNGVVNFDVPSMSDFTAEGGEMIAGELLLNMANDYFKKNGLEPNGSIRSEYWTQAMGETASQKIAREIEKF